jgi:hypothetical protein
LVPKDGANPGRPYVGRAVRHISKSEPRAVAQGYAPVIPFKLEKIP